MPFDALYGQEQAVAQLRAALTEGRLAQAYLFCGPAGTGKTAAALEFAKALHCEAKNGDACGSCSSCVRIDKGHYPDVHVIDLQGEDITIDDIRQMQKDLSLRAYEGGKQVYIVKDAHCLNAYSSNALLKTLEEPAKDAVIVLVAEKPELLFKTIISRCRVIRFKSLSASAMVRVLRDTYGVKEHTARFLAYYCEGRLGSALALKDTDFLAVKNKLLDAWLREGTAASFADKQVLRESLNILAGWLRDVCLYKTGVAVDALMHSDRMDLLEAYAPKMSVAQAVQGVKAVSEAIFYLEHNINTKLVVTSVRGYLVRSA